MIIPEQCSNIPLGDGSVLEENPLFVTVTSDGELPLPSPYLLDIHRRFANALHLFSIEDKIALGWPRSKGKICEYLEIMRELTILQPSFVRRSSSKQFTGFGFAFPSGYV